MKHATHNNQLSPADRAALIQLWGDAGAGQDARRAAAEVKLLQEPSLAKLRAIAKMQHIHPALMLIARAVNMPALNFAARASFKHSTRPLLYDHTLIISITCRKMYPIIARSSTIKAPVIRIFICWPFPIALPV
jgi:hypothetical protein